MLISELAPWYLIGRAAIVALFIAGGAFEARIGQVGLALFVLSELGLVVLVRRSLQAAGDVGHRPGLLDLFVVKLRLPEDVSLTRQVRYWGDLTLDVYRRLDTKDAPALVYVHPGSWMRGRPGRQALPLLYELASNGWVVLDIRYPLSPQATFPTHLIGVKRAIAWAKNQGRDLGIDPNRVAIAGASSGAHLAALAALTWDDPGLQPGFESFDTSVMACVPHYGIYDLLIRNPTRHDWPFVAQFVMKAHRDDAPDLYRLGSPLDQVRPDAPPFLVIHGALDSIVLAEESRHFVDALTRVGATVDHHEVRGAQHGYDAVASVRTRAVAGLVAGFLYRAAGEPEGRVTPQAE
jgi:acetyl esterase/lipase